MNIKKCSLAQIRMNEAFPGFFTFFDFTKSTNFSIEGQISMALSAAGTFSSQRWSQKGMGNVDDNVADVKSSLLAGALWKR